MITFAKASWVYHFFRMIRNMMLETGMLDRVQHLVFRFDLRIEMRMIIIKSIANDYMKYQVGHYISIFRNL